MQHAITRNISVFIAPSTDRNRTSRKGDSRRGIGSNRAVLFVHVVLQRTHGRNTRRGRNGWTRGRRTDRRTGREGGKRGRFAYAYKICRGHAISRPIAWKTHAKISILGHLACNLIKQDQRLDLTIGIIGRVEQRGVPSVSTLVCEWGCAHLRGAPDPPQRGIYASRPFHACRCIGTMILMFARHFTLLSFLPSNPFESWRVVGHDWRTSRDSVVPKASFTLFVQPFGIGTDQHKIDGTLNNVIYTRQLQYRRGSISLKRLIW